MSYTPYFRNIERRYISQSIIVTAFAYFAFEYYKKEHEGLAFTFGVLALMFQPFIKLALGRVMWNVVDVVVGLGLVYLAYLEFKKKD